MHNNTYASIGWLKAGVREGSAMDGPVASTLRVALIGVSSAAPWDHPRR